MSRPLSALILAVALWTTVACESPIPLADNTEPPPSNPPPSNPPPSPPPSPPPGSDKTFLVVGNPGGLNPSERAIRDRLSNGGLDVVLVDDDALSTPGPCELVVLSKTSQSLTVGNKLKGVHCGVVFWEDNQQMLSMMATIDNDGSNGTTWHSNRTSVIVQGGAPSELRGGQSGTVQLYAQSGEITWAPDGDLPGSAIVIALLGSPTNGRTAIYAFEEGAVLADGSRAAGRRVYFGLYDDTFVLLTPAGRALFDAAVAWARD